jgi:hypothetical protein
MTSASGAPTPNREAQITLLRLDLLLPTFTRQRKIRSARRSDKSNEGEKDLKQQRTKEPHNQSNPFKGRVSPLALTDERRQHLGPHRHRTPLRAAPAEERPAAAAREELEAAHIGDGDKGGSREEEARRRRHLVGVHRLEIGLLAAAFSVSLAAAGRVLLAQLIRGIPDVRSGSNRQADVQPLTD